MTHEEILTTLGHYVDYLIAGSTAEAPLRKHMYRGQRASETGIHDS